MINRVIRYLLFYDFVLNFAFGLLAPIFAVFVLKQVSGAKLEVVGIATACYWIARVLTTVPLSRFMDKTDGERDEFYFTFFGTLFISTIPLLFIVARVPWHIYAIQALYGLSNSMAVPGWRILFTDHLDHGKTGYEWAWQDVAGGIAVGASAYFGSLLADRYGFSAVLVIISVLGYLSTLLLLPVFHDAKTLAEIKAEHALGLIKKRRQMMAVGSHRVK